MVFETVLVFVSLLHDRMFVGFLIDLPVSLGKQGVVVLKTLFNALHSLSEFLKFKIKHLIFNFFVILNLRRGILIARLVTAIAHPIIAFPAVIYLSLTKTFFAFITRASCSNVRSEWMIILAERSRDYNFRHI